jgi:hypothetical protein
MNNNIKQNYNILPNFLDHCNYTKKVFDLSKDQTKNIIEPINNLFITCPICYIATFDAIRPNSCGHYFCKRCLFIWTKYKTECPYCRKKFTKIIHK